MNDREIESRHSVKIPRFLVGSEGNLMDKCAVCGELGVGYIDQYQGQKRVGSYPVCLEHLTKAYMITEYLQDFIRSKVAGVTGILGIKKGSLPRFKVRFRK